MNKQKSTLQAKAIVNVSKGRKMKKVLVLMLLLTAIIPQLVMAQEENGNEGTEVAVSLGFMFNMKRASENNDNISFNEIGLNANIMIFPGTSDRLERETITRRGRSRAGSDIGYYINPYAVFEVQGNTGNRDSMQLYAGIIPGIGFRRQFNDKLSMLMGFGPDISMAFERLGGNEDTSPQFGLGLGGNIEIRFQIFSNLSLAAGSLFQYNFSEHRDRKYIIGPYLGLAWN